MKAKFKNEKKNFFKKEHRIEVKFWKKELGEVTKHKIKLEKRVKQSEPDSNQHPKAIIEKAKVCDEDWNKNLINFKSCETSSFATKLETTDCTICAELFQIMNLHYSMVLR